MAHAPSMPIGLAVLVPLAALAGGGLVDLADVVQARRDLRAVLVHTARSVPLEPRDELPTLAAQRAVDAWPRRGRTEVVARVRDGRLRLEGRVAYPPPVGVLGRRLVLRHVVVLELPDDASVGAASEGTAADPRPPRHAGVDP